MNIAHYFTLLRIIITPIFPILYLGYESLGISFETVPYLMLGCLLVCEFSDLFDGFLARKLNKVTDLGKILDPIADTITHISLFMTFTQGVVGLPLYVVFIFLYRELFIGGVRTLCALKGVALAARMSGKIKAVLQAFACVSIVSLMIPFSKGIISLESFRSACLNISWIVAFYTVISIFDYVRANRFYLAQALSS